MTGLSLEPCWVKVSRAQAHFDALNAEVSSFLSTSPYAVTLQDDLETKGVIAYVEALQEPPRSWGVVTGDCVHNLRTALDYLISAIVKAEGGTPGERNEFPIAYDAGYYANTKGTKLAGVPDEIVDRIEALQPYPGRDDWRQDLLVLHDLDRYDKHRFLQVTGHVIEFWRFITSTTNGVAKPWYALSPSGGRFEPGQEIGRVTFEPVGADSKLEVSVDVTFDVAFDETESAAPGRTLLPTLVGCFNAVRRVLQAFA